MGFVSRGIKVQIVGWVEYSHSRVTRFKDQGEQSQLIHKFVICHDFIQ